MQAETVLPVGTFNTPRTLSEALRMTTASSDAVILAGGIDMMVQRAQGNNRATSLIDLTRIAELSGITEEADGIVIGACTRLAEIERSTLLADRTPALVAAARAIASPVVRESATIAGNLLCENRCVYFDQSEFWRESVGYCLKCGGDVCIASGGTRNCYSVFVSDLAPVLICLDAQVRVAEPNGARSASVEDLYTGDGAKPRALPSNSIVTDIVLSQGALAGGGKVFFHKLRQRASVDFTSLTVAMRVTGETLTVAASGVSARPAVIRLPCETNHESITEALLAKTQIIENHSAGRIYRRDMVKRTVRQGMIALGLSAG